MGLRSKKRDPGATLAWKCLTGSRNEEAAWDWPDVHGRRSKWEGGCLGRGASPALVKKTASSSNLNHSALPEPGPHRTPLAQFGRPTPSGGRAR